LEGPVLRRFDLEEDLFGTEPDLSGGHTDVSAYVRGVDRDVDAYILWRRVQGDGAVSPDEQVPIHPDELCPVPFYEAKDAFKNQRVWILTLATGRRGGSAWRQARGSDILPGDTVMVDVSLGCYSETTGWDPGRRDAHPTVIVDRWEQDGRPLRAWVSIGSGKTPTLVELIDERVVGPRAREEDPRSFSRQWMELSDHLRRAYQEALRLAQTLGLPSNLEQAVARAALWHDVGKALERDINGQPVQPFQQMLRDSGMSAGGHPKPGVLYAKSNGRGKKPAGFRHEVASLLAFLQSDRPDDLTAFLILAHHGKVRLFPQPWDEDDPTDLCGVRTGDRIPAGAIPCVSGSAGFVLNADELFPSQNRRSWQGRVKRLLDEYGPFLLAYLEALVRVADWRAS
jgi:CRISPR-associated endonuclease/helicase Cas3